MRKLAVKNWHYSLIAATGALIFCIIYGLKPLIPTNIEWLLQDGDLGQHYLGWVAYRNSSWSFPIGLMDTLSYPQHVSVIFTDSIPALAIIFKTISFLLPTNFQYFGLYGIICFILQGIISAKIFSHYIEHKLYISLASILIIFTPQLFARMFAHTALASHWLILLALHLSIITLSHKQKNIHIGLVFFTFGALLPSVHFYFVGICGIIISCTAATILVVNKNIKQTAIIIVSYSTGIISTSYLLGAFDSHLDATSDGLDKFSSNLNTLFNPSDYSFFLQPLPLLDQTQMEGYGYLGFGTILLIIISFILMLQRKQKLLHISPVALTAVITALVAFIASLSPKITLNDHVIVNINYPQIVWDAWSIFRSTGRFIWVVVYILAITSVIILYKCSQKIVSLTVICSAMCLQIVDLHSSLDQHNIHTASRTIFLPNPIFDQVASQRQIKHVVFDSRPGNKDTFAIADWALNHGITLSDFYFARSSHALAEHNFNHAIETLNDDTIFVFAGDKRNGCINYNLMCYQTDNYVVGIRK